LAFNFVTTGLEKGLKFLLLMVASRALAEHGFGMYQWAHTLTIVLAQVTDFGLGTYLTREVARRGAEGSRLFAGALGLKLVLAAVCLVAVVGAAAVLADDSTTRSVLILLAVANLGQTFVELFDHVFRGFERLEFETLLLGTHSALTIGGGILVLRHGGNLVQFAAVMAVCSSIVAAAGLWLITAKFYRLAPSFDVGVWRDLIRTIYPLGGAMLLSLLYSKIVVQFLSSMMGFRAAGLYAGAARILDMTLVAPAILMAAVFPAVSRPDGRGRLQLSGLAILAGVGLVVGTTFMLAPAFILRAVCGSGFVESAPVLQTLGLCVPLMMVNFALTHYLIAQDLQLRYMGYCLVLFGLNVCLNVLLIPLFGIVGSAWATVVTEAVLTVLCLSALWPQRRGGWSATRWFGGWTPSPTSRCLGSAPPYLSNTVPPSS
jgi:O-antigen/teichoic acid export membrane protein